jgi:hypothetical protein
LTVRSKDPFTASTRDKIREAWDKGKRVIVINDQKYSMVKGKHDTIIVRPKTTGNDTRKTPLAVIDSKKRLAAKDKAMGESMAKHAKDVKSGAKKSRINPKITKAVR